MARNWHQDQEWTLLSLPSHPHVFVFSRGSLSFLFGSVRCLIFVRCGGSAMLGGFAHSVLRFLLNVGLFDL